MARSRWLVPLALMLTPLLALARASATEVGASSAPDAERVRAELLARLVERERVPSAVIALPRLGPPGGATSTSALDCISADHDITLNPATGKTDATLELRVRAAGKPLTTVNVSFDKGLQPGKVTASGRSVDANDAVFAPARVVQMTLDPPLASGDETVLTIPYAGTLSCAPALGGAVACTKDPDFSFFGNQSVFPFVFDPALPESTAFDGLTRKIVFHVPANDDVVVTGQKVSETTDGDTKTSTWTIDKPFSRIANMYALVGKLGQKDIAGRSPKTTLVFPRPEGSLDDNLALWSSPALNFVEKTSGRALPFDRGLTLVRLPKTLGDPGTATFGMTLLSDSYSKMGDLLYEETWAHENTHLFWGIVIPETDSAESRLMTEGMATLSELEYTYAQHFADQDRDLYFARRFVPMALDMRAHEGIIPPIQVGHDDALKDDFRGATYMFWAYYQTSATLDHLRVTLGEDVFADVLAAYRDRCSFVGCSPDVLQEIASTKSGHDMTPFFDRWIRARERPHVVIDWSGGEDATLTKDDDRPMTLELWLGLEDGSRVKRRVDLADQTTRVRFDTALPLRSVAASPRHDVLVDIRSAVDGDLDFDGETDGFDILRCARLVTRTYSSRGATGLWNVDEAFDPRCDVDSNFTIDDADLDALAAKFGKLRGR